MVGCRGTGKTSFAHSASARSKEGPWPSAPTLSTQCHKVWLETGLRVDLWETPTWELTLDPEAHFDRGCDAVMFIMDCTRRATVDEVLLHWLHVARYHCAEKAPFLFIGAKSDRDPQEAKALVSRLEKWQLPVMIGSCLEPSFAVEALEQLHYLTEHEGRPKMPLLARLPPLELPEVVSAQAVPALGPPARPSGGSLPTESALPSSLSAPSATSAPSALASFTPSTHPRSKQKVAKVEVTPKWQIAAGDLTYFERLDAEPSRAGRSPSVYAKWKDMPVVAKRVEKKLLDRHSQKHFERLLSELSANQCPHLAKFYGATMNEDPVALVMEYMPGGDLEQFLRSKRLDNHRPWIPPRDLLFSWAISCSSAMAYLANLKVAHGNIRPSNLLLCTSLALRLSPSGALSPVAHRHQVDAKSLDSCLYSAPEMLKKLDGETPAVDEELCIKADVFALGLVLWFMCTGARPLQHLDNDGMHKPSDHVVKAFKDGRRPRPRLADA
ncbi:Mitogen-activated protein kinase kinase kinase 7 (Transforming growth factor-beta-activated kinase 1) (TGF-beta-activated kinase 1) [Durusdinium trenchii]|uniref:Mitogen-activated protein kinase kinase kinase 7 (Transforming growth factor-beta-activated kinase 1) (TGF-beta-activated kinase 1) n=1 Tax=Durusdinium trenchii TaxID=1381693 RepID=A0ABP0S6L3_9DINO